MIVLLLTPTGQASKNTDVNLSGFGQRRTHSLRAPVFITTLNHKIWRLAMDIPTELNYTDNDEWIKIDGNVGLIGITDYAQDQLSDIVFVEVIVSEGEIVKKGDACATVESVKAAADVYMPVSGEIITVNDELADVPETINSDPYGDAWMVKVELSDPAEIDRLLDSNGYEKLIEERE